jgi:serine/threonine protein kinase
VNVVIESSGYLVIWLSGHLVIDWTIDMLTAGTSLGPYEIIAPLGAGGMGEVYRARDTKLNRDVAIKVLPDSFANDAERLARFTREAQTLAALNHPNIAAIYGLEEGPAEEPVNELLCLPRFMGVPPSLVCEIRGSDAVGRITR